MKEVPGSPAFLIGHTFLRHSNNAAIAGMALRPQTQNAYFLNHPRSVHLGKAVGWELDNELKKRELVAALVSDGAHSSMVCLEEVKREKREA